MADEMVKDAVLVALNNLGHTLPGFEHTAVVRADSLEDVRAKLGLDVSLSNTKLGEALRSLHCKGLIRCARPRGGYLERRPYEITLLAGAI